MTSYSTYTDAITAEIVAPITAGDASIDDYDVERIAALTIAGNGSDGFTIAVDPDEFWNIVAKCAVR